MSLEEIILAGSPEFILLVFGTAILIIDMIMTRVRRVGRAKRMVADPGDTHLLPYVALLGLLAAFGATLALLPAEETSLLFGMMVVDGFARFMTLVAILSVLLVVLLSIDYLRGHPHAGEFYSLLLFAALSISLIAASTNLVMIFLSLEFLSLTTTVLVCYLLDNPRSTEAAIKFFIFSVVSAAVLLYGLSLLYGLTGQLQLGLIAQGLAQIDGESLRWAGSVALTFILAGFGFKIAAVPFHQWVPDAYEGAPTPITAFLSVSSKIAGFAVLIRVLLTAFSTLTIEWTTAVAILSLLTMTLGNVVAIVQTDIKRLFAYSSIANMGYILIGLAAMGPARDGLVAILVFVLAYLFTNIGAFAVIILVEMLTGRTGIQEYAGMARRSLPVAFALAVFLLSLIGFPSTAGFVGKFFLFKAAIGENLLWLAVAAIVNTVISAYYYLNVVRLMFFEPATDIAPTPSRVNGQRGLPILKAAVVVTFIMIFVIGLYPQPFIELVKQSSRLAHL